MFHTMKHEDYHRPTDDIEKINFEGTQQVARLMFRTVATAANADTLASFRPAAFDEHNYDRNRQTAISVAPPPARLGVSWDPKLAETRIIKVTGVAPGSPAERSGLKVGDRLLEFAGYKLDKVDDFRAVVLAADNPVHAVVEREGSAEPLEISLQLDGSPQRIGFAWRFDPADPGVAILTQVVSGSPAGRVGLLAGDRMESVDGKEFASDAGLHQLLASRKSPLSITVERNGRMRDVTLEILPPP